MCFSQTDYKLYFEKADSIYYSNPDSSYKISLWIEAQNIKFSNELNVAKSKIQIARYLLLKSSLEQSMIYLNEAIPVLTRDNSLNDLAKAYNLKAILLKRLNKTEEAVELEKKAIDFYKLNNNEMGCKSILLNLSLDYIDLKKFDEAQASLAEVEKSKSLSKTYWYYLHQNKGKLFLELKVFDLAIKEFQSAMQIAKENKMLDSEATILMEIGKAYRLNSDFENAKKYLSQSEELCVNHKMKHELVETYEEIILLYQATGKYGLAYNFLKLQNELKNEIINVEKINKINDLEKKLAILQKEKEIKNERENTQKAKNKNLIMTYAIIAIGAFCAVIVILFLRTRKLKNQIQIKSAIIEAKQREILDSIQYARRIQQSILTSDVYIEKNIKRLNKTV